MSDGAGRPALVIFDCDGVLVDSEAIAHRVIAQMLTEAGWPVSPSQAHDLFVGGTVAAVVEEARRHVAGLPGDYVEQIYARLYAALETTPAVPGVVEALDALDAAALPYAVGSNGPHAKMAITLASAGLIDRLRGKIVSREDVPRPKPAPDVFLEAAARVGAPPARTLVVGDSRADIAASAAAGMRFLGYAGTGGGDRSLFEGQGRDWIDDLRRLPQHLGL